MFYYVLAPEPGGGGKGIDLSSRGEASRHLHRLSLKEKGGNQEKKKKRVQAVLKAQAAELSSSKGKKILYA